MCNGSTSVGRSVGEEEVEEEDEEEEEGPSSHLSLSSSYRSLSPSPFCPPPVSKTDFPLLAPV